MLTGFVLSILKTGYFTGFNPPLESTVNPSVLSLTALSTSCKESDVDVLLNVAVSLMVLSAAVSLFSGELPHAAKPTAATISKL
jgi:hypothetical protein